MSTRIVAIKTFDIDLNLLFNSEEPDEADDDDDDGDCGGDGGDGGDGGE